ncbi:MAG: TRAP transporter small permease subunit, partial [Proteobacteria bacterium]|nr:TRAP transporter small permease subunit [Pseudomonadota bacterium]
MKARHARWLQQADRWGRWLENAVLFFLLGGLIVLSASQIALRNIFSTGLPWADPAVRMMVLWLALAGGIAAGGARKQIAIDVVTRLLPARARRMADTV